MRKAIKEFDIEERSTSNMWYCINVMRGSRIVESFVKSTMRAARSAFEAAGYKEVEEEQ